MDSEDFKVLFENTIGIVFIVKSYKLLAFHNACCGGVAVMAVSKFIDIIPAVKFNIGQACGFWAEDKICTDTYAGKNGND